MNITLLLTPLRFAQTLAEKERIRDNIVKYLLASSALEIDGKTLLLEDAQELLFLFSNYPLPLRALKVKGEIASHEIGVVLAKAIDKNLSFQCVSFTHGALKGSHASLLIRSLHHKTILGLKVSQNKLVKNELALQALKACIENNTKLATLNLSGNDFSPHSMIILAPSIARHRTLMQLDIGSNKLRDKGIHYLAQMLVVHHNKTLKRLKANDNEMKDIGIQALCHYGIFNTQLRALELDNNAIGEAGLSSLGQMLAFHPSLQILNLSSCGIKDNIAVLMPSLEANLILQHLSLKSNPIGSRGITALANMVRHNKTLQSLVLKWNPLEDEAALLLIDAFAIAPLKMLQMDLSTLSLSAMTRIADSIMRIKDKTVDHSPFGLTIYGLAPKAPAILNEAIEPPRQIAVQPILILSHPGIQETRASLSCTQPLSPNPS